jgi:hypothetical protein
MPPRANEAWVFCDESGNSGIDYLDPNSPFLVVGGFIVAGDARRKAEQAILAFVNMLGLSITRDLKFKDLWKEGRQDKTLALIRSLGKARTLPVFYMMQKRFAIAGKIVDVFLDPMHNKAASWLPTTALRKRIDLTELVYTVHDDTLRAFGEAYRAPTRHRDTLRACLEQLIRFADATGNIQLAHGFRGAMESLGGIIEAEDFDRRDTGRHSTLASLNIPTLTQFLRKCDMILDMYRPKRGVVVHDEQEQFASSFREYTRMIQAVGVGHKNLESVLARDGINVDRVGVRNIHQFEMRSAESEPLLLAADILAGGIARLMRSVFRGEPWTEAEYELAELTLPAVMGEQEAMAGYYADDNLIVEALGRLINRQGPRRAE